jgi:hypothetical protein
MKRPLCIALWTVAAFLLAWALEGPSISWSLTVAQGIANAIARATGNSPAILSAATCYDYNALQWACASAMLVLGLLGRLPGTRRKPP